MAYVYCADVWCKNCGDAIKQRLTIEGKAPADPDCEWSYDSDEFPKHVGDKESDVPQHCAAGVDCINAIKIGVEENHKVGLLFGGLTRDGIDYVEDAIIDANHSGLTGLTWNREVAGLWYHYYSDQGYQFRITPNWEKTMNNRLLTLTRLSGLPVTSYVKRGIRYFVFGTTDRTIKSVCTYRKAKVFAEGVAVGRSL